MKTTIYDIAKAAGVSIATVSKVINETGRISAETRERVKEIMQEMDYQPSVVAAALTGKSTFTIGLLIPDLANPFYAEIARAVEDRGQELGFNLVMCSTDNKPSKEAQYISLLKQKKVDGIIVSTGFSEEALLQSLIEQHIPIALLARDMPSLEADSVKVDDAWGGYRAVSHLIELGHRRIAVIAENLKLANMRERVQGYCRALSEADIPFDDELVEVSDFSAEGAKDCAYRLLERPKPPTAIFACNDLLATGVIRAARELGLTIPWDLSVVGFDDIAVAEIVDPPLTTINQPIARMGRQVIDLLVEEIRGQKRIPRKVVLTPELVIRQSTTFPRAVD